MRIVSSLNIASLAVLITVIALLTSEAHYEPLVSKYEEKYEQERVAKEVARKNHQPIDLGLSVKWSSKNFEISTGEDRFAWDKGWARYISTDQTKDLTLADDIVYNYYELDGTWRIPTAEELKELAEKCEWIQVVERNKKGKVKKEDGSPILKGYKVIGPSGDSIFISSRHKCEFFSTSRDAKLHIQPKRDQDGKIVVDAKPELLIERFNYNNSVWGKIRPVSILK